MKKALLALTLAMSFNAFSYSVTQTVAYTVAEIIYVTALTGATAEVSSEVTTNAVSSKLQKQEAMKIQNHVQNYIQSGEISPYLESKLNVVYSVSSEASEEEAIDILLETSSAILAK